LSPVTPNAKPGTLGLEGYYGMFCVLLAVMNASSVIAEKQSWHMLAWLGKGEEMLRAIEQAWMMDGHWRWDL
jgi:hypothetical protein